METKLTPEQVEIQKKTSETKTILQEATIRQLIAKSNSEDKFIEVLFDKGGKLLVEYSKITSETNRYAIEKDNEFQKEELKVIDRLDTKEKIYKGVLISLCVLALVLSAMFIPKAEVIIPVLSLIIGLLFKSSSLADFFSHSKGKHDQTHQD
jgi:hypothetical protein